MNDRELLEMAAKAAGMKVGDREALDGWICIIGEKSLFADEVEHYIWNPLDDDGDALRLAITLDIHINRYAGSTTAKEWCSRIDSTEHDQWKVNCGDAMKSTRRAIVRAAAKIGKSMP